jgi:hypothetical protein
MTYAENLTRFKGFETLRAVWLYSRSGRVYYHAPMDCQPRAVTVLKQFKNGKLRIEAPGLTFTADAGHLDRFKRLVVVSNL